MTDFRGISLLLIVTSLICCCGCEESIASVIQRLSQFDRKLLNNKKEILGMEENVLSLIEVSKTELRAELKENIREQVREAMMEILHGDSLQDMVSSEVVSELRHLKRDYHRMKRRLSNFSKSLKGLQDKMDVLHQPIPKKTDVWNGRDSCVVCVRDKDRLEIELYKCNVTAADLKTDIDRLMVVNETCQSEISQMKTTLGVPASPGSVQDVNTVSNSPVPTSVATHRPLVSTTSVTTPKPPMSTTSVKTPGPPQLTTSVTTPRPPMSTTSVTTPGPPQLTTSVTTPRPPVSTTSVTMPRPQATKTSVMTSRLPVLTASVTTLRPEEEKRKILIAPLWSEIMHQFRQLNIRSKSINVYPYHTLQGVRCLAYIAKTQKLLIGFGYPGKIMSSTLDASYTAVVREGVKTYGMAVDEERDIVFMTTEAPRRTISRMSTQGKDFTTITDLSKYGIWWPVGIALDNKRKKIYACKGEIMFILTYDGEGLETLARGSRMFAVFLDQTAGMLYYNNERKLMKMAVSSNVSTEVTTLDAIPWSMTLYRGTIYYGSYSPREVNSGIIGAVDLTFNTVPYILKSIRMHRISGLLIQPIP